MAFQREGWSGAIISMCGAHRPPARLGGGAAAAAVVGSLLPLSPSGGERFELSGADGAASSGAPLQGLATTAPGWISSAAHEGDRYAAEPRRSGERSAFITGQLGRPECVGNASLMRRPGMELVEGQGTLVPHPTRSSTANEHSHTIHNSIGHLAPTRTPPPSYPSIPQPCLASLWLSTACFSWPARSRLWRGTLARAPHWRPSGCKPRSAQR